MTVLQEALVFDTADLEKLVSSNCFSEHGFASVFDFLMLGSACQLTLPWSTFEYKPALIERKQLQI